MSQENVQLVQRAVERWNAEDIEGWLRYWHTDAELISEALGSFEGRDRIFRGHAGLRQFTRELLEGFATQGRLEGVEFRDADNVVVLLGHYSVRAAAGGPVIATPMGWTFEIREGQIARARDFLDRQEALEAAGLSE